MVIGDLLTFLRPRPPGTLRGGVRREASLWSITDPSGEDEVDAGEDGLSQKERG